MTIASIALAAIRAAVILGVALAAMPLLARTSAATRRSVLVGAFAIVLALPIATAVLPALHLRGDTVAETPALVAASTPETIVEATLSSITSVTLPIAQAVPVADAPREAATSGSHSFLLPLMPWP